MGATSARPGARLDPCCRRELEAKNEEPLYAFTLATPTGNKDLLDRTALRALRVADRSELGADSMWRDRLVRSKDILSPHARTGTDPARQSLRRREQDNFEAGRTAHAWRFLQKLSVLLQGHQHNHNCSYDTACPALKKTVPALIGTLLGSMDPVASNLSLSAHLTYPQGQGCTARVFHTLFAAAEQEWATSAPQFSQTQWFVHDVSSLQVDGI